jgi:hypothetical protein
VDEHRIDPPRAASASALTPPLECTAVGFADGAQAREILETNDAWMQSTGPVQRSALMRQTVAASPGAFAAWQGAAVRTWNAADQERWRQAWRQIAPDLNRLSLPLPPQVVLISTTGAESENTPHTRSNAVVLPLHANAGAFTDAELLAHELFHVMTRYAPDLRDSLYALVGFEPVNELRWPQAWKTQRISDQDAPHCSHAMRVTLAGKPTLIMPVVVAAHVHAARAGAAPQTLEDLAQVRLLEIAPGVGALPSTARMNGAQPVWHRVDDVPEYRLRLGANTDYIVHPEEALADNFMFLVSHRAVADPALLLQIESVLQRAARPRSVPAALDRCPAAPPLSR